VNLAQRLESISKAGDIVVSSLTTDVIPPNIDIAVSFEPMGSLRIKGIQREINPLRVIYK
jgi:class 3 adenylate cyclase